MAIETVAAKAKRRRRLAGASEAEIEQAANDSICAMMLIRTYRVRGHLAADLDPLGLVQREMPADLTPEFHGFTGEGALDRPVWLGGALGLEKASVREVVEILRRNYCGHVGLEYMHINDLEERRFLQDRMEGKDAEISFTPEGKQIDPDQGRPGRAMGEVPRPQICRHQALRPRRRRDRWCRRSRR